MPRVGLEATLSLRQRLATWEYRSVKVTSATLSSPLTGENRCCCWSWPNSQIKLVLYFNLLSNVLVEQCLNSIYNFNVHFPLRSVWCQLAMSESASDTESSCGWTVISNEVWFMFLDLTCCFYCIFLYSVLWINTSWYGCYWVGGIIGIWNVIRKW